MVLICATGCLAAAAYAASTRTAGARSQVEGAGGLRSRAAARPARPTPPRPRITAHPAATTISTSVAFRFVARQSQLQLQCRLDGAPWKRCAARVGYRGLAAGPHRFLVRAEGREGARGSLPARFAWTQMAAKHFSIEADLSGLSRLYPGAPAVALPLVVSNPNPAPIFITGLRVAVTADPAGCSSGENLELIQSSASKAAPLEVPAGGSLRLPAKGTSAPAIALRDLPVNQDACQAAQFPLAFSGEARG